MISSKVMSASVEQFKASSATCGTRGYFFIFFPTSQRMTGWSSCREGFRGQWTGQSDFIGFACTRPGFQESISNFFDHIEEQLGIAKKSKFFRMKDCPHGILMEVSPFWMEYRTRRDLLSLFVRYGAQYHNVDEKPVWSRYDLAQRTVPAIEHFLAGNTVPTNDNVGSGWATMYSPYQSGTPSLAAALTAPKRVEKPAPKVEAPAPKPAAPRLYVPSAKVILPTSKHFGKTFDIVSQTPKFVTLSINKKESVYRAASVEILAKE